MTTAYFTTDDADLDVPEFPAPSQVTDTDSTDETDLAEDSDSEESRETRRTRTGARRTGNRRAEVRRDIAKYVQLSGTDAEDLDLLATLYGVPADALELTVAIMAGSRASLTAVTDLNAIAAADPFDAPLVAAALAPAQLKAVHSLLVTLGGASTKDLPGGAVTKVAGRLARDVHGLDPAARQRLDRVLGLTKRTT